MSGRLPLWKMVEAPLLALDESHVELLSLLVLFVLAGLALAAPRRRRQWVRHLVQVTALAVFVYVVYSCLGVFGMIRNTIHGVGLIGTVFTEAFFWMSLPVAVIALSLLAGPVFCGWICPTGTFQEAATALSERLRRRRAPAGKEPRHRARALLLGLLLGLFLATVFWLGSSRRFYVEDSSLFWAAALLVLVYLVYLGRADDGALRRLRGLSFAVILASALLRSAIISPMHFAFADVNDPASALTTLVLVVAALVVGRAWCRYLCPWGYLLGRLHRFSRLRVATRASCAECDGCGQVCRVGAIVRGRVRLERCQLCLACVDACPQENLELVDVWQRERAQPADD